MTMPQILGFANYAITLSAIGATMTSASTPLEAESRQGANQPAHFQFQQGGGNRRRWQPAPFDQGIDRCFVAAHEIQKLGFIRRQAGQFLCWRVASRGAGIRQCAEIIHQL